MSFYTFVQNNSGSVSHRATQIMGYEYCQALVMYQGMKRLD